MNSVRIIDSLTNKTVLICKQAKQAKQAIYKLERTDRQTGDFVPYRYSIVIKGYRTDRLNKQARRAFELQEV